MLPICASSEKPFILAPLLDENLFEKNDCWSGIQISNSNVKM
uniref:Uncharacterized protein n=1 Tax=Anguilla anguilla TaxID=7936 RepID=A0A0E9QL90_ANGAN